QAATADAFLVAVGPDVAQRLTAHDLPADHPIERTAVEQLIGALGHHARDMNVLGLLALLFLVGEPLLDPVLEILDRVRTDAQFDEMQRHESYLGPSIEVVHGAAVSHENAAFVACRANDQPLRRLAEIPSTFGVLDARDHGNRALWRAAEHARR